MKKVIPFLTLALAAPTVALADKAENLREDIADRKEKIAEATKEIEEINSRLEEIQSEATRIETIEESIAGMDGLEKEATKRIAKAEQELKDLALIAAQYQRQYQPQTNFKVGEKLGVLTDKAGRSYKGAVIKGVLKDSVRVAHAAGFAVIPFTDLPAQYNNRYKMPPESQGDDVMANVIAKRPESMKAADKKKTTSTAKAPVTKTDLQKQAMDTRVKEREEILAKRDREHAETLARNKLRAEVHQKTMVINREISSLELAVRQLGYEKSDQLKAINDRGVRPSASRIEEELAPIDRKIAAAKAAILRKQKELRTLSDKLRQ